MHKLPHKVADSQGDFYFPDQIPNPSMDMILSERISPQEADCRHSFWHLFSYGRVNDRTNLEIKQSSMTMRSISCLFFFPNFFFPMSTVLFVNFHWIVFWMIIQEIRWDYFVYCFYIFIFCLLELTTVTVLKLIALTIGSFITSCQALR